MARRLSGRVLHVGKFYPPHRGGMESFLADLIEEQRRQGLYAIGLVHGKPLQDDPSWLHRVPVQAEVLYAPMGMGFPFALRRLVREFEPDVLHLHMPNNAAFWCLVMRTTRRVPWVVHWQSDVVLSKIRRALSAAYALYEPFERAILSRAHRVIATSPPYLAASPTLQPWLHKSTVIPLGLADQTRPAARVTPASAAWQPGAFRLLSIGRLVYYKGFETLIRAVASVPGAQLLIVGEGEMRASLEALISTIEVPDGAPPPVVLLGAVSEADKHALLASCDVFCLASCERTEAFGLVLIEAMQHAKPCIVSDLPGSGMPWVVSQAGAGLHVALDDLGAWKSAIERLRDSPELRRQMGASGQQSARGTFSIGTCAQRIADIYINAAPDIILADPNKDTLLIVLAPEDSPVRGADVDALRRAGWPDVLVIGPPGAAQHLRDATHLTPVLPMGRWGSTQTGLRYALQHGYQRAITLDIGTLPDADTLRLLNAAARQQPAPPDVVIGAAPQPLGARRRLAWRWLKTIAGIDLQDPSSPLRLYNRDAMVVASSREATLLDYEDIGTLMLFRKARLQITEVEVVRLETRAPSDSPTDSILGTLRYLTATSMLCFSNWSVRHVRRSSQR